MQFTTLLALLPVLALAAPTSPIKANALERRVVADIEKRADTGVYLCTDRNWTGHCVHIIAPSGTCVPLASDLNDLVSSAGPDAGAICYFFVNAGCDVNGGSIHLESPGVADLSVTPVNGPPGSTHNYEDQFSSYRCTTL